ncbi:MAG: endolytic transglycosylase MltG [Eubacterium sp.]|nr:endolytic transglycosylase MltG [Eubacterium sp.]
MKLKYYLRGMGIGIVITTLLFMIFISIHKNDGTGQSVGEPQQNTESKTVAQLQESTQEALVETETAQPVLEKNQKPSDVSGQKDKNTETNLAPDKTAPADTAKGEKPETPETPKPEKKPEPESETQPQPPKQQEPQKEEKVRIEISGGQYSDTVCKKLAEAGLVDDAKAFNDYLVQKDYDNSILPGVYEIPKGATYEEIAVLLTTKVR